MGSSRSPGAGPPAQVTPAAGPPSWPSIRVAVQPGTAGTAATVIGAGKNSSTVVVPASGCSPSTNSVRSTTLPGAAVAGSHSLWAAAGVAAATSAAAAATPEAITRLIQCSHPSRRASMRDPSVVKVARGRQAVPAGCACWRLRTSGARSDLPLPVIGDVADAELVALGVPEDDPPDSVGLAPVGLAVHALVDQRRAEPKQAVDLVVRQSHGEINVHPVLAGRGAVYP